ncbi:signal peptidase II [Alicyclobacillus sp.]|uniref:signal peptidase II n=1 Tax=Alicyclobacillus sp. TaxID=61169 RepID=UPI0025C211A8|nr:signal peptidase II [Alicyclobacillus sp.]MCL6515399.1 signal peptidase II [Alicyclobacillus sp.]
MLYIVALLVLVLDQVIKTVVKTHMALGQTIPLWPGVLDLQFIRNPGAAWGMLGNARWFLVAVAVLVSAVVIWISRRYRLSAWNTVALGLVLGGALGNLWDRVATGTVVDYVYVEAIHFPVFNLADSAVCVGVAMLLLGSMRQESNRRDAGGVGSGDIAGDGRRPGEEPRS